MKKNQVSEQDQTENADSYNKNPYTIKDIGDFAPFKCLVNHPRGSLLFYSNRYHPQDVPLELGKSKEESFKDLFNGYNNLNDLSKRYVDILINIIADTKPKKPTKEETSFEGLVLESRPLIVESGDGFDRMDCYDFATQQINLCTTQKVVHYFNSKNVRKELEIPNEKDCISNLIHELIHAIDDNTINLASGQAVQNLYSSQIEIEITKEIMNLAANLVSPTGALHKHYLQSYYEKSHFFNQDRKADIDITLIEFLSFHNEIIFENLKLSESPQIFNNLYTKHLEIFAKTFPGTAQSKQEALKLIKETSVEFLEVVMKHENIDKTLKIALGYISPAFIHAINVTDTAIEQPLTKPIPSEIKREKTNKRKSTLNQELEFRQNKRKSKKPLEKTVKTEEKLLEDNVDTTFTKKSNIALEKENKTSNESLPINKLLQGQAQNIGQGIPKVLLLLST